MGLRIPEQLSVVFFDDYELSGLSRIPPTYVIHREYELGKIKDGRIVSVIENPMQEQRKIEVPTELVIGRSIALAGGSHRNKIIKKIGGLIDEDCFDGGIDE